MIFTCLVCGERYLTTEEVIESHKHLFGNHTFKEAWIEAETSMFSIKNEVKD